MSHDSEHNVIEKKPAVALVEHVIFNIRWTLLIFYFGLIGVLGLYGYTYAIELINLLRNIPTSTEEMKIAVLDMVDIVMVANLVKMIITGSYNSFVSKDHGYRNERISSGMLKVKIMTSIMIVSSISLLRSFMTVDTSADIIAKQLLIYGAFLIGALALGIIEYIHIKGDVLEHEIHNK